LSRVGLTADSHVDQSKPRRPMQGLCTHRGDSSSGHRCRFADNSLRTITHNTDCGAGAAICGRRQHRNENVIAAISFLGSRA
jgi:hypothetical protein